MRDKFRITKKTRENITELWEIITTNYKCDVSIEELSEVILHTVIDEIYDVVRDKKITTTT